MAFLITTIKINKRTIEPINVKDGSNNGSGERLKGKINLPAISGIAGKSLINGFIPRIKSGGVSTATLLLNIKNKSPDSIHISIIGISSL